MTGIDVCRQYIGINRYNNTQEIEDLLKNQAHNGDIVLNPATTPWCAVWMNFCERSAGNPGNGHENARSFLDYGKGVYLKDAQEGDIVVWDFEHDGVHGHVTYFVSHDSDNNLITCLGGNQENEVKYSAYNANNLAGIRRY